MELENLTPERRAFIAGDVMDFVARYPQFGVNEVAMLESSRPFRQFCGTRFGVEPLWQLYADYLELMSGAEQAAAAKATRRSARSTGGGTAGTSPLTPEQQRTLDAWNAEHPEMAMTAREFLER
ncbi:MAG: hypothetical protein E7211_21330 [Clostridium lundense]|jgi:hypothetical protein|nr:hypothetical protein [Clostridium lundense]